jgi:hypothetical protein
LPAFWGIDFFGGQAGHRFWYGLHDGFELPPRVPLYSSLSSVLDKVSLEALWGSIPELAGLG